MQFHENALCAVVTLVSYWFTDSPSHQTQPGTHSPLTLDLKVFRNQNCHGRMWRTDFFSMLVSFSFSTFSLNLSHGPPSENTVHVFEIFFFCVCGQSNFCTCWFLFVNIIYKGLLNCEWLILYILNQKYWFRMAVIMS